MRGKTTNLFMALLNILVGLLLIIFSIKIPQDVTELTVQENQIVFVLRWVLYIIIACTVVFNAIEYIANEQNSTRRNGYLIAFFVVAYYLFKHYVIGGIAIIGGIVILYGNLKEKWIELNSISFISIISVVIAASLIVLGMCFIYKNLGSYIIKKQNENEIAYKEDYFRYVTDIGIDDIYINVKKNGKFGYINTRGDIVIDFKYDYASPFIKINSYNKEFEIALVCADGRSQIILKNERLVMSYRSESLDTNYEAKIVELKDIYTNTMKQEGNMQFEILETQDSMTRIPVYEEESESYTYRYDYNETYDILVTQSNMGLGDTYELARKDNLNHRIELDCEKLDYDEEFLYIYSNGNIPFYERSMKKQGWFTNDGRKVVLNGNGQILDFIKGNILLKDHNQNTIYFINNDEEINILSQSYKEIFICDEDRYIVKKSNNKYAVIDSNYQNVIDEEWDFVDLSLISHGIYVFGNTNGVINFNEYNYSNNMKLKAYDRDGNLILDNIEQIYKTYYEISDDENQKYADRYSNFLNNLKKMDTEFVGDEFYK